MDRESDAEGDTQLLGRWQGSVWIEEKESRCCPGAAPGALLGNVLSGLGVPGLAWPGLSHAEMRASLHACGDPADQAMCGTAEAECLARAQGDLQATMWAEGMTSQLPVVAAGVLGRPSHAWSHGNPGLKNTCSGDQGHRLRWDGDAGACLCPEPVGRLPLWLTCIHVAAYRY